MAADGKQHLELETKPATMSYTTQSVEPAHELDEGITSMARMGRSVVLIEDSDDHAELVRRALMLSAARHELVRFEDGEQALSYLITAPDAASNLAKCAVILLDLSLPGVSGIEVLQALRELDNVVCPVVVLTTSAGGEDIAAAYANGARAYCVKPVDLKSFRELVQDLTNFWVKWNKIPKRL